MAHDVDPPGHVCRQLFHRGRAGRGLNDSHAVVWNGALIPADQACRQQPSQEMRALAQDVQKFLAASGARNIDVIQDYHQKGRPGCLTVRWTGEIRACDVAAEFAVSVRQDDGTPQIPSWLALRAEDDFDLRWQDPF